MILVESKAVSPSTSSSTAARQRRMELRRQSSSTLETRKSRSNTKRNREEEEDDYEEDDHSLSSSSSKAESTGSTFTTKDASNSSKKKSKTQKVNDCTLSSTTTECVVNNYDDDVSIYRGIKKQARYEPTIPITSKEELAAWRKEARRIRNRESAAASRIKTKERIDVLEDQLQTMTKQYHAALQQIQELQQKLTVVQSGTPGHNVVHSLSLANNSSQLSTSSCIHVDRTPTTNNDHHNEASLLLWSPEHQSAAEALASSLLSFTTTSEVQPTSPTINIIAPDTTASSSTTPTTGTTPTDCIASRTIASTYQHPTNHLHNQNHYDPNLKNSRPTAVCVL